MQDVDKFSGGRDTMLTFSCRFAIAAALLCLAGCADTGRAWTKAGVSTAQRAADFNECQDEARQQTQRQYAIDSDIMASRGNDWRRSGTYNLESDRLTADAGDKSTRIMNACMVGKGYAPAS
jgi:hypothetical protein